MRFAKIFGLAVIAAVAAMAFVGAGTASAQHKIVLCKELVTLCPSGKLWGAGTKFIALAKNPELHSSIGTTIKCEDSVVSAESSEEINSPLKFKNFSLSFGVLPTPTLGANCTGTCTSGAAQNIHSTLESLQIEVEATDKYFLTGTGNALLLNCPIFGTCAYKGTNIKVPITHTGSHALAPGQTTLPLANFNVTLQRVTEPHKGSAFCPATSNWLADYVLYAAEQGGSKGFAWPSLDK